MFGKARQSFGADPKPARFRPQRPFPPRMFAGAHLGLNATAQIDPDRPGHRQDGLPAQQDEAQRPLLLLLLLRPFHCDRPELVRVRQHQVHVPGHRMVVGTGVSQGAPWRLRWGVEGIGCEGSATITLETDKLFPRQNTTSLPLTIWRPWVIQRDGFAVRAIYI